MTGCEAHAPPQPAVCSRCAAIASARRARLRKLAVLGPIVALCAGGGAWLLTRPTHAPPPAPPPDADPIDGFQLARLAKDPCERETSAARIAHLMETQRWRDAQAFATSSIAHCGVLGRMQWSLAYVDQQLKDYAGVESVTTALIAEQPGDSDFWWWRGEAYAYHRQPAAALADYRQSLALSDGAQAAQFAAQRFALAATDAKEPCELDRAWRYAVRTLGLPPSQEMRDATAAHARDHACAPEAGIGRARLGEHPRVTLVGDDPAGATAVLELDPRLGTTLIARSFAARAGIDAAGEARAAATAGGKLYTGVPLRVTLRVGDAMARGVDVLVTDDLPGDAPGILGLSFLWHFQREGGALAPADERPL